MFLVLSKGLDIPWLNFVDQTFFTFFLQRHVNTPSQEGL